MGGIFGGGGGGGGGSSATSAATQQQQYELDQTNAATTQANTQLQKDKLIQQYHNEFTKVVMEQGQFNKSLAEKIDLSR